MALPASSDEAIELVAKLGEGIPFFIEELATAQGDAYESVPHGIDLAVRARLQRLSKKDRSVVCAAALMIGFLDVDVLARAEGLEPATVTRILGDAAHAGLVVDREGLLVFRHALVREALAQSLISIEVEELYRKLAVAIEDVYSADLNAHAMALAQHWYRGRRRARAKSWALIAGQRALELAALSDARSAFELALSSSEAEPPPEALVGLGEVEIR